MKAWVLTKEGRIFRSKVFIIHENFLRIANPEVYNYVTGEFEGIEEDEILIPMSNITLVTIKKEGKARKS